MWSGAESMAASLPHGVMAPHPQHQSPESAPPRELADLARFVGLGID